MDFPGGSVAAEIMPDDKGTAVQGPQSPDALHKDSAYLVLLSGEHSQTDRALPPGV